MKESRNVLLVWSKDNVYTKHKNIMSAHHRRIRYHTLTDMTYIQGHKNTVDNDVLSWQHNITKEELIKIILQSRRKSYVCQHIWQQFFFLSWYLQLLAYPKKDNNLFEPYLRVNWSSCLLVLSQFLSRVVYGMSDLSSLQINHSLVELSIADRVVLQ